MDLRQIETTLASVLLSLLVTGVVMGEEMSVVVEQVTPEDDAILEEWSRVTDDEDVLGVGTHRTADDEWYWIVFVNVAEFIRTEPLQSQLAIAITRALEKAPGVNKVVREDREVWLLEGDTSGEELIRACAKALAELEEKLRAAISDLDAAT